MRISLVINWWSTLYLSFEHGKLARANNLIICSKLSPKSTFGLAEVNSIPYVFYWVSDNILSQTFVNIASMFLLRSDCHNYIIESEIYPFDFRFMCCLNLVKASVFSFLIVSWYFLLSFAIIVTKFLAFVSRHWQRTMPMQSEARY